MTIAKALLPLFLLVGAALAQAELRPLDEGELQDVTGQDGISLSANLTFAPNPVLTRCAGGCGARVAIKPGHSDGFIVVDNILGTFSFEGLKLDIVTIDSGFAGEGAQFNGQALRLELTEARFENARFTLGSSNQARGDQAGFRQTDLLTYSTNGEVRLHGNLYFFAAP